MAPRERGVGRLVASGDRNRGDRPQQARASDLAQLRATPCLGLPTAGNMTDPQL
jgi:hypothetical protein